MSDTCPKCGAALRADCKTWWECLSNSFTGKFLQSDKCRIAELEGVLRSLASFLGVGGYNAETVDATEFEAKIREGIDIVTRPFEAENTRLRNDLRLTREGLQEALRQAGELEVKCQR